MRKLARLTFNVLAAMSLLLCVAACVLWVRGYHVPDVLYLTVATTDCRGYRDTTWAVTSARGSLGVECWVILADAAQVRDSGHATPGRAWDAEYHHVGPSGG